jgi:integrase/recombinase XerC
MDPTLQRYPNPNGWLLNGALAPHVDAFGEHLRQGRYAPSTTNRYLACIAHFARWMTLSRAAVEHIDEAAVSRFLTDHLPGCSCPAPVVRVYADLRAACGHLLQVLREQGVVAEPAVATGPIADELRRFDEHMRGVRGLADKTRSGRVCIVQRLLQRQFADRPVVIAELRPADVRWFIADQLDRHRTASNASALASALCAYFRYRTTCGDQVHALAGVIASPAHCSLASLPRSLTAAEIDRLLGSFTSELPSPRRGYAMVRCALDLGLRASEIAKLTLRDIDWRAGTVTLRGTKSRRQDILPLPAATGRALADYLRRERPATSNPAVFVRRKAPRDLPVGVDAVRRVIRDAYRRIGLPHARAHALRHTLARRLLEHGSSLKEVADVLRHRSLNTTLIYAKLDSPRLAAVALPWPGSAS